MSKNTKILNKNQDEINTKDIEIENSNTSSKIETPSSEHIEDIESVSQAEIIDNLPDLETTSQNEIFETAEEETNSKNIENEETTKKEYVPYTPLNNKKNKHMSVPVLICILVFVVLILSFVIFTIYNTLNTNIISGVSIKGINVSNMSKFDAKQKLDNYLNNRLPEEISLKHGDFETTISLSQINSSFDTQSACNSAYNIGRTGNIFKNDFSIMSTLFNNINIEPEVILDTEQLTKNLEEISTQLPDTVVQSSYYVENGNLILTSGKNGNVIDVDATIKSIQDTISSLSFDTPIEITVKDIAPDKIDIEKIYNEIHTEPVNASYTTNPFTVYPSKNGYDFGISLEEAKSMIESEEKEEYSIPLKVLYPSITTNMIGTEAFPDLLSEFSTSYAASNKNRTTNLILAANKINGTVIMPGATFSYNKVVGARTIAARI